MSQDKFNAARRAKDLSDRVNRAMDKADKTKAKDRGFETFYIEHSIMASDLFEGMDALCNALDGIPSGNVGFGNQLGKRDDGKTIEGLVFETTREGAVKVQDILGQQVLDTALRPITPNRPPKPIYFGR